MTVLEQKQTILAGGADRLATWRTEAFQRLDRSYEMAHRVPFDDASRIIFFSDTHRGVGNRIDTFQQNKALFLQVLKGYYQRGFNYIEVGDGDELWQNPDFSAVRQAHNEVFDLLHRFNDDGRLHLIIGNHDSQEGLFDPMHKDGIPVQQSILLQHTNSGQRLFAVHGHQANREGDERWPVHRLQSRTFWKFILHLGFHSWQHFTQPNAGLSQPVRLANVPRWLNKRILSEAKAVAARIQEWMIRQRTPVICGHTHLADFPRSFKQPYFNTGNCTSPGYLTGLELFEGDLRLDLWQLADGRPQQRILAQSPLSHYK